MVDSFIEMMDEKYERKLYKAQLKTGSAKELKVLMVQGVLDSDVMSEKQKTHTIKVIETHELPKAVWEGSTFMKPAMIGSLTLEFLPKDYTRREEEAGRVRTMVRKGRFGSILSKFETPSNRRTVSEGLGAELGLSWATISRDLSPMFRAGYVERISRGIYKMTDLGKEMMGNL